ncbi:MAG: hypothetical protein NTV34_13800 [Proteobacteria bacterium]|nr:hypothetical protein [Pseudomonadota bacterium]
MNTFQIVVLASAIIFNLACQTQDLEEDLPIRVEAVSSLQVNVGDYVHWTFRAWRGNREVSVIGINFGGLPFGLKPDDGNTQPGISGKILGRQFRTGLISVSAFDSKACEVEYGATKRLALRNAMALGAKDLTIPTSPCAPAKMASSLQEYGVIATFQWNLIDGPDNIKIEDVPKFLTSLISQSPVVEAKSIIAKQKGKSLSPPISAAIISELYVPGLESVHTFDLSLGPCAAMPKNRCGDLGKKCLWNFGACSTAELNALTSDPVKI